MGRWAKPRTLLEWTRTALASSTSKPRTRLNELGQRDAGLQPGQVGAEAEVAPLPKLSRLEPISRPIERSRRDRRRPARRGCAEPGSSSSTSPSGIAVS